MFLWIGFAFLTAAVVAMLLRPLRKPGGGPLAPAEADMAVYRDQLRELDAERDRGLIAVNDLDSARAEVARRLIKRAKDGAGDADGPVTADAPRARRIYLGIATALPVLAVALYLAMGSPDLPDQPFTERVAARQDGDANQAAAIAELIHRVEQRLKERPDDGKGWDVIAPVYLRLGRFADAAHAFAEANRLEGDSVRRLLGFAEATLMAENGIVTEPVRKAATRVLELEPDRIEVGVWLALAKEQDGDLAGALAAYRELLGKAPQDAPWRSVVGERIAQVEGKMTGKPAASAPEPERPAAAPAAPRESAAKAAAPAPQGGPSGDTPDAAAMSPAERDAFIASMVDRLAERLAADGKDLDGWLRLARAYKVLGRDGEAQGALASARSNFAGEATSLAKIDEAEASLGLAAKQ